MNKHTIIVIIASIVIAIPFAHAVWNYASLGNLELRASELGRFSFFEIITGKGIQICNSYLIYDSFDRIDITIFYQDDNEGTYTIPANTLAPSSQTILEGNFRSELFAEAQYTLLHMDGEFTGTAPKRLDPNQMIVTLNIQTYVLGIIPISIYEQYRAFDFYNLMNQDNTSCQIMQMICLFRLYQLTRE